MFCLDKGGCLGEMRVLTRAARSLRMTNSLAARDSSSLIAEAPYDLQFGPGGRHSNSGITATVFGAYGFIGKYYMSELGNNLY